MQLIYTSPTSWRESARS
uniref:Uncharacterized protein n=1 Tax=Arundo donax TaxID=35708 RepID=A0A0A8Y5I8_ARUDO